MFRLQVEKSFNIERSSLEEILATSSMYSDKTMDVKWLVKMVDA